MGEVKQAWGLLEGLWGLTHPSRDMVVLHDHVRAHLPLHKDTHGVQPVDGGIRQGPQVEDLLQPS